MMRDMIGKKEETHPVSGCASVNDFICESTKLSIYHRSASRLFRRLQGHTGLLIRVANMEGGQTSRFESLSVPDGGNVGGFRFFSLACYELHGFYGLHHYLLFVILTVN